MAVYEHAYKPYAGPLTPEWSRFLIIPRHAYRDVFRSKLFTGFFALCFVCPLVMAILIYLHHNLSALGFFNINPLDLRRNLPINGPFFQTFVSVQTSLAFLLTVLIGPPLISRDLANNGLPLYLCRPFSRAEYVIGKMSVLVILISAITWVPGELLFLYQTQNGDVWVGGTARLGFYHQQQWKTFGAAEGFLSDGAHCILETPDGRIWCGSRGRSCIFAERRC